MPVFFYFKHQFKKICCFYSWLMQYVRIPTLISYAPVFFLRHMKYFKSLLEALNSKYSAAQVVFRNLYYFLFYLPFGEKKLTNCKCAWWWKMFHLLKIHTEIWLGYLFLFFYSQQEAHHSDATHLHLFAPLEFYF